MVILLRIISKKIIMIDVVNYQNEYRGKGHNCPNLLIRCMDFRFHRTLDELLPELFSDEGGIKDYDSPGVAGGGSKSIIDEASRPVVFSAIDIAIEKHHISRIIVVNHVDCGAYGGSSQFTSPDEEEKFHRGELKKAEEILTAKYPELEIIILYQDWNNLKIVN